VETPDVLFCLGCLNFKLKRANQPDAFCPDIKQETTMKFSRFPVLVALLIFAFLLNGVARDRKNSKASAKEAPAEKFPVTTASAAAARYFETGMVNYENHRWNFALNDWHEAIKLDPRFALAYTWICMTTTDPAEESSDRAQAKAAVSQMTPAEQLMVRWMAGIHENNYVEGIAAMNDLLALYPRDKRLNFLVAYWLYKQDEYDLAEKLTLRALAQDSSYATAYNQLGYIYSRRGDYPKALEAAGKYVKLLPNEPNPHDSYAEMLRLSGRFDEALTHYRMALKIDPTFYISQKELGETYALMGNGEKARAEYAKAIHEAPSDGLKAEYLQKSAMTWLRDKQYDQADKAYQDAAAQAHAMQQWIWEARAYRIMAMYQADQAAAEDDLEQAEGLLAVKKGAVAKSDLDEEKARILRVRVERAVAAGDLAIAGEIVKKLEHMSNAGGSIAIERTYHGAAGTLLVAHKKYTDAISQLEEDFANPISMKLLLTAYEQSGNTQQAAALRKKLAEWRIPSVEEALVVPTVRAQQAIAVSKK
jgi:tetratricopeptide (TPR) repeat protein